MGHTDIGEQAGRDDGWLDGGRGRWLDPQQLTEGAPVSVGVVGAPRLKVGNGRSSVIRIGMVEKRIDDGGAGAAAEDSGGEQQNGCAGEPGTLHWGPI